LNVGYLIPALIVDAINANVGRFRTNSGRVCHSYSTYGAATVLGVVEVFQVRDINLERYSATIAPVLRCTNEIDEKSPDGRIPVALRFISLTLRTVRGKAVGSPRVSREDLGWLLLIAAGASLQLRHLTSRIFVLVVILAAPTAVRNVPESALAAFVRLAFKNAEKGLVWVDAA